jgi:hypothetical protein
MHGSKVKNNGILAKLAIYVKSLSNIHRNSCFYVYLVYILNAPLFQNTAKVSAHKAARTRDHCRGKGFH